MALLLAKTCLQSTLRGAASVWFLVACLGVDSRRVPVKFVSKACVSRMATQHPRSHMILQVSENRNAWESLSLSLRKLSQPRAKARICGQGSVSEKHLLSFIQATNMMQKPESYFMGAGLH